MKRLLILAPFILLLSACPGIERGCSSCTAKALGANWVVVELTEHGGKPYRCWTLRGASIQNEQQSDGIYWKDPQNGNLVHVSGSYDYIQVVGGNWDEAYAELNMTEDACEAIADRRYDVDAGEYR